MLQLCWWTFLKYHQFNIVHLLTRYSAVQSSVQWSEVISTVQLHIQYSVFSAVQWNIQYSYFQIKYSEVQYSLHYSAVFYTMHLHIQYIAVQYSGQYTYIFRYSAVTYSVQCTHVLSTVHLHIQQSAVTYSVEYTSVCSRVQSTWSTPLPALPLQRSMQIFPLNQGYWQAEHG